jgi:hypothetical protein
MRRRTLLVALVGLAVVLLAAAGVWPRPSSRITRENYQRICEGMTAARKTPLAGQALVAPLVPVT